MNLFWWLNLDGHPDYIEAGAGLLAIFVGWMALLPFPVVLVVLTFGLLAMIMAPIESRWHHAREEKKRLKSLA